ncbi:MAG: hypothetical protein JST96_06215 [Bacteroidetes bacterium]|nr:hypothetical protein [Bacteroidota bacterium]
MKQSNEMYPLAQGNVWIYADSFYDVDGTYVGKDTFRLKTIKPFQFKGQTYTPITDQFDDSIFVIRSNDSSVFIMEGPGEALLSKWPMDTSEPFITNSYYGDTLTSVINTRVINFTNFPSYRTIITYNDGSLAGYRQEELYFTKGKGIIKGRDIWKTFSGATFISDSYTLISYSFY